MEHSAIFDLTNSQIMKTLNLIALIVLLSISNSGFSQTDSLASQENEGYTLLIEGSKFFQKDLVVKPDYKITVWTGQDKYRGRVAINDSIITINGEVIPLNEITGMRAIEKWRKTKTIGASIVLVGMATYLIATASMGLEYIIAGVCVTSSIYGVIASNGKKYKRKSGWNFKILKVRNERSNI